MGFGLPAALAHKSRDRTIPLSVSPVTALHDECARAGHRKTQAVTVENLLLDNQRLGMVRQWQQLFFQNDTAKPPLLITPISSC